MVLGAAIVLLGASCGSSPIDSSDGPYYVELRKCVEEQGIDLQLANPPAEIESAIAVCYARLGPPPIPPSSFDDLATLAPSVVAEAGDVFRAVALSCMIEHGVSAEFEKRGGVYELVILDGSTAAHLDTIVPCLGVAKEAERIFLDDIAPIGD